MARKPHKAAKPSKAGVKAAADRAERRAKGEELDDPKVPITPHIERAGPGGRPSPYKAEYCQKVAELSLVGCTDEEIATELGVDVRTVYRWKAAHPEFRQSWLWGKEEHEAERGERVERSLYARAIGYTFDAVKIFQYDGAPVIVPHKEHVPPDVGAAKFYLTNRRADRWAEKIKSEHSGPGGGPIAVADISKLELARWIAHQLTQAEPKALTAADVA